ncbi:hypothetical protein, conserved [Leishmania tarentolae]|uniref:Signal recognition particle receptor subunit beta n=1 Tax=Leishmania tarentolae TaxID=5689 RepID=A0A640KQJ8_LEITA|nr:hypothetical protein, conserved [Leishmania tarentolae]
MSFLDAVLVNETIIEAVRVALEKYAAEGHQLPVPSGDTGLSLEEENVIRRGVLAGFQELSAAAQLNLSSMKSLEHAKGTGSRAPSHSASLIASSTPRAWTSALARLGSNATAMHDFVQEAVSNIWTHVCRGAGRNEDGGEPIPATALYAATPEVTRALQAAAAAQHAVEGRAPVLEDAASSITVGGIGMRLSAFSASEWVWLSATLALGYLVVFFVFGRILDFDGMLSRRRPRTTTVLIGLPGSGKTALFAQLVHHEQLLDSRTSMRENSGYIRAAAQYGRSNNTAGVKVVDCPGHPRLHQGMLRALSEATYVVVVIDSVTVQDSQQEGVAALAELLFNVLQTPEFYGVRRLLFACTKRDEAISYASKAVRKLLEAAMVASIESRQNAIGRVDTVRDSKNAIISSESTSGSGRRGGGRRYMLSLEGADSDDGESQAGLRQKHLRGAAGGNVKKFSFDQLGIPLAFVDVSSRPNAAEHKYSITIIEDFLLKSG